MITILRLAALGFIMGILFPNVHHEFLLGCAIVLWIACTEWERSNELTKEGDRIIKCIADQIGYKIDALETEIDEKLNQLEGSVKEELSEMDSPFLD